MSLFELITHIIGIQGHIIWMHVDLIEYHQLLVIIMS